MKFFDLDVNMVCLLQYDDFDILSAKKFFDFISHSHYEINNGNLFFFVKNCKKRYINK